MKILALIVLKVVEPNVLLGLNKYHCCCFFYFYFFQDSQNAAVSVMGKKMGRDNNSLPLGSRKTALVQVFYIALKLVNIFNIVAKIL